ncbi:MAG: hypothetical protein JRC91_08440 [Deltaproteobacteria bacterium]|nr:hypothetical protein [Deltaproteobacteria bacterium]
MNEHLCEFQKSLWEKLDSKGFEKVKQELSLGVYSGKKKNYAEEWLRIQEEAIIVEKDSRKESREEKTLKIAQDANTIARSAKNAAFWASLGAIIAAICAIISVYITINKS